LGQLDWRLQTPYPWWPRVAPLLEAALRAVEPAEAVRRHLARTRPPPTGDASLAGPAGEILLIGDRPYPLAQIERVFLVGAGKAGEPMARAAAEILGDKLAGGVVVVKEGYASGLPFGPADNPPACLILEASHPLPDERGLAGARRIVRLLEQAGPADLVLALFSGGGSALLPAPPPGVSLADLQTLTAALLACGADIGQINTLRKHLDLLKGGQLARLAAPARLAALLLSDVVGDPLDVIASGPTVPDPTTFAEAWAILEGYGLLDRLPASILDALRRGCQGAWPETPKPGDPLFERVQSLVIGSNRQAAQAALAQARAAGFHAALLTTYLQGEARQAGRFLGAIARQLAASGEPLPRPACLVAGGETTVTLRGQGLGGRNQELALAAAGEIAGLPHLAILTLATDGGDGPTDAAGAVVTGETLPRASRLGLHPAAALANNDTYPFFSALGDLLRPGPTRTNVNDLAFVLAF
jgi:glycerate 2-kinase